MAVGWSVAVNESKQLRSVPQSVVLVFCGLQGKPKSSELEKGHVIQVPGAEAA